MSYYFQMKTKSRQFKSYTEDDTLAAYYDVRLGMSVRRAAAQHIVPHTTLWNRVSNRVPLSAKDGGKPKLTVENETKLIGYAHDFQNPISFVLLVIWQV